MELDLLPSVCALVERLHCNIIEIDVPPTSDERPAVQVTIIKLLHC